MGTHIHKLEVLANICIIVISVLLAMVIVTQYLVPPGSSATPPAPAIGAAVEVAGIDWRANRLTLLIGLRPGCHFCEESAPFYRRLLEEAHASRITVVALFQQPLDESNRYLDGLALPIKDVRQVTFKTLGIGGVPVVILAGQDGKVIGSWLGRLTFAKEKELRAAINAKRTDRSSNGTH